MSNIKVIALYGKAGAGKDALLQATMKLAGTEVNEIISCTTRPPRQGEVNHINYHFVTLEEFTQMVLKGDMLEATEFRAWWYGTPLLSLDSDKVNIGVFNPAGMVALKEDPRLEVIPVKVEATDKVRLLRQLNREDDPDVAEIIRRYQTDEKDFREYEEEHEDNVFYIDNSCGSLEAKAQLLLTMSRAFGQNKLSNID